MNKLHKELKTQKQKTQQVEQEIYGSLGIPLGGRKLTDVPDRPSFVYVRLRDNQNEVVQAFNNKVTSSYNLPVIIHREGTRYIVDGVNTQRYQSNWNNAAAYLPRHGTNHSFYDGGGGDVTWVFSRQIMPYLVYPDSTITGSFLKVSPHTLLDSNNQWKIVGGTGTPSVLQYLPTGGNDAIMGLLYIDSPTGNPRLIINSGTPFSNLLTGTGDIYQYIPVPNTNTQIPLAAIRLSSGTTNINWDNLYDVRQWIHTFPSGTSSGGGGGNSSGTFVNIWDEGILKGVVNTLNVVSDIADISVSGSVARLFITGSASGGVVNPPITGSFVVQNNGLTLGSATILNFTNGVSASISGSVAQIVVTGTSYYVRTAPPVSLSNVTGTYWQVPERVFASGSLALFNQGHALIPAIDYLEQYPNSGTFQYISLPPTGTYNVAIYGVPIAGGGSSGGGGGGTTLSVQDEGFPIGTPSTLNFTGNYVNASTSGTVSNIRIPASQNDVPSNIRGLQLWLRSDYFSGFSNNQVVTGTWQDFSGLENDASPIGSPTVKTNQINGQPSILLNGSNQYFFIKTPITSPTMCYFAIFNMNSLANAYTGIIGYDAFTDRGGYFIKSNGKSAEYFGSNSYDGTGAATFVTGTWNYISDNHKPALFDTRRNGVVDKSGTTSAPISAHTLLQWGTQIVGGRFLSGNLVELIMYGRELSDAEISSIESYIQSRYGL